MIWRRFPEGCKKLLTKKEGGAALSITNGATAQTAASSSGLGGAFLDALTYPLTWILWAAMFGGVWWYSHNLLTSPSWVWIPLLLWTLSVLFSRASASSAEKNGGKEKKPHAGLAAATKIIGRLAFLSTLAVVAYYVHFAPAGTWKKLTGKVGAETIYAPNKMVIPKGSPLGPNFTSLQLENNWNVTYIASNVHYQPRQTAWSGKKLTMRKEPRREITEVVNLTLGFGQDELLDLQLKGVCEEITGNERPEVSKACAGSWKDRGSEISGKFYLEVREGGSSRYIYAYLYDGNYLPREKNLFMLLFSGPPTPHIMLQFMPKDWSREKG